MKKLTASLLALPMFLAGSAFAADHKDMREDDPAAFHREMCSDRYAHAFGKVAYLQAKLGITDKQQAAWDAWQKVELDTAAHERDACLNDKPKGDNPASILDQEKHIETMLQGKLAELQASRGPLETLYGQLDDTQKDEFNHFGEWHHHPNDEEGQAPHEGPGGDH